MFSVVQQKHVLLFNFYYGISFDAPLGIFPHVHLQKSVSKITQPSILNRQPQDCHYKSSIVLLVPVMPMLDREGSGLVAPATVLEAGEMLKMHQGFGICSCLMSLWRTTCQNVKMDGS
ncbi:hypothetical protein TNCV_2292911 [Trichonephila clavipes]|nr:hypothetical protein TNCV_2292911 [Trichonephila clavipes]